jgi:hypothetical protein
MTNRFLDYLEREHARLELAIAAANRGSNPDTDELSRLKKLKLAVRDQIASWHRDSLDSELLD